MFDQQPKGIAATGHTPRWSQQVGVRVNGGDAAGQPCLRENKSAAPGRSVSGEGKGGRLPRKGKNETQGNKGDMTHHVRTFEKGGRPQAPRENFFVARGARGGRTLSKHLKKNKKQTTGQSWSPPTSPREKEKSRSTGDRRPRGGKI